MSWLGILGSSFLYLLASLHHRVLFFISSLPGEWAELACHTAHHKACIRHYLWWFSLPLLAADFYLLRSLLFLWYCALCLVTSNSGNLD